MLLPALNKAREKAKTANCQGNLKQFGLAAQQYADDNQGFLTPSGAASTATGNWIYGSSLAWSWNRAALHFPGILYQYLGGRTEGINWSSGLRDFKLVWCLGSVYTDSIGYIMNGFIGGYPCSDNGSSTLPGELWTTSKLRHPSRTVLYADGPADSSYNAGRLNQSSEKYGYEPFQRHGFRTNAAWADGHVAATAARELWLSWRETPGGTEIYRWNENGPNWSPRKQ